MKKIICDRCKKEIGIDKAILLRNEMGNISGWNVIHERFDLCAECRDKVLNRLKNK